MAEYAKVIRKVAQEEGWPVAENNALMRQARAAGKQVMAADGIHPNYLGQSLMARSRPRRAGPQGRATAAYSFAAPRLFPGVIRVWKMRATIRWMRRSGRRCSTTRR